MIDDSERREIAARLRFTDHNLTWNEGCFCIAEDVGAAPTGNEHNDVLDFAHALADLIDRPTAKREHNGAYWRCAHCGAFTRKDAVSIDGLDVVPLRHCGNCGREWDYD